MPAKDVFHEAVKKALLNEGWTITADPLYIQFGGVDLYVDLAAEKIIAAEKDLSSLMTEFLAQNNLQYTIIANTSSDYALPSSSKEKSDQIW